MAFRTRLSVADIFHRGFVWSLFGVTVWGAVMIGVVHRNTLAAGRGTREAAGRSEKYPDEPGGTERDCPRGGGPGRIEGTFEPAMTVTITKLLSEAHISNDISGAYCSQFPQLQRLNGRFQSIHPSIHVP
ncbi:hypothetical protein LXA43DRAFT_645390 [Ganoderma leucocontextum]|nr:hypothetical protein LXA43DRAFT_645390 [Ganoderma leucocontextum]